MLPALATGWVGGSSDPLLLWNSLCFPPGNDSHLNLWLLYSASGWKGSQPLSQCLVDKFDGMGVGGWG